MPSPKISAIMPIFNTESYLESSVRSVLAQSYRAFELLLLDDGSTDGSLHVARRLAANDPRIRVLHHENSGISASLNRLIEESRYPYLAIAHADDICEPSRFERQLDYLERNETIGILGSAVTTIDGRGRVTGSIAYPRSPHTVSVLGVTECVFAHPAVMLRRSDLDKLEHAYRPDYSITEDYELWSRLLRVAGGANLDDRLVQYRIHEEQNTAQRNQLMIELHADVSADNLNFRCPSRRSTRRGFRLYSTSVGNHPVISDPDDMGELYATAFHVLRFLAEAQPSPPGDPELIGFLKRETRRVERRALGGTVLNPEWRRLARCYLDQRYARRIRLLRYFLKVWARRLRPSPDA